MFGDRLGILVGVRELHDVEIDAGQRLPQRPGEILRLERLKSRLVGQVERDPLVLVLLGRLHRAVGRSVCRALARRLHGGGLRLTKRGALVGQFDLRDVGHRRPSLRPGGGVAQSRKHCGSAKEHEPCQELATRGVASKPRVNFL